MRPYEAISHKQLACAPEAQGTVTEAGGCQCLGCALIIGGQAGQSHALRRPGLCTHRLVQGGHRLAAVPAVQRAVRYSLSIQQTITAHGSRSAVGQPYAVAVLHRQQAGQRLGSRCRTRAHLLATSKPRRPSAAPDAARRSPCSSAPAASHGKSCKRMAVGWLCEVAAAAARA